jgi:hypothetical protein
LGYNKVYPIRGGNKMNEVIKGIEKQIQDLNERLLTWKKDKVYCHELTIEKTTLEDVLEKIKKAM